MKGSDIVSRRLTYEEVQKRIEERGCKLLSKEYYRNSDKLDILCPQGHTFKMKLNDFSNGHGCPYCAGLARHSYEYIKEQIEKEGFVLLSKEYKNARQKLDMICPNGHEVSVTWNNFYFGFRCKQCHNSKGEIEISKVLDNMSIKYKHHHHFEDCKYINTLEFDFYIPSMNICIEFDGEQHFRPVAFGNMTDEQAKQQFEINKKRDEIKNTYCEQNKIKLIRIPYWDFDKIEKILNSQL